MFGSIGFSCYVTPEETMDKRWIDAAILQKKSIGVFVGSDKSLLPGYNPSALESFAGAFDVFQNSPFSHHRLGDFGRGVQRDPANGGFSTH
jgi:hypothetical protein